MSNILLKGFPPVEHVRAKQAAAARGLSLAEYFAKLVGLHDVVRSLADGGDTRLEEILTELGLETVRA